MYSFIVLGESWSNMTVTHSYHIGTVVKKNLKELVQLETRDHIAIYSKSNFVIINRFGIINRYGDLFSFSTIQYIEILLEF